MIANYTIRPAARTDLASIESLLVSSQLPTDGVKEALDGFLVAESEGKLIGVVGMEHCGDYGLLRSTAVTPEWRGKRVARELVERVIGSAESQGVKALYLLTTTAERYFPTFGFKETKRDSAPAAVKATIEFREACSATAICMSLPLAR